MGDRHRGFNAIYGCFISSACGEYKDIRIILNIFVCLKQFILKMENILNTHYHPVREKRLLQTDKK